MGRQQSDRRGDGTLLWLRPNGDRLAASSPGMGGCHGSILSCDPSTGKWSPRLGQILALRFWVAPGLATVLHGCSTVATWKPPKDPISIQPICRTVGLLGPPNRR